jgi:5,10-methylenetetrahydromethanopterin reductase
MRLGILFDGFDDAREMIRLAREAEAAGAGSVWIAEHMGYREAVVAAAAIAAATGRVRLVPTAVSPYLWHPTPTAMAFATLDELAPGRVAVAISVGNVLNLRESGEEPVRPVRALREFAEDLRALWAGEAVTRQALTYRLDGARMAFRPAHPIPIYVASTGPHVLRLAGRIADGVLLSGGQSLAFTRRCLAWAAEGVAEAGRDPASLARASFIYFSVSKDGRAAVDDLKRKIAFLFRSDRQAENIASTGLPINHAAIIAAVKRRDLDSAAGLVPDEAIDAFCVGGTPDNCRSRLRAYLEAGVEEPVLQISGTPENKALALDLVREFARW